MTHSATITIAFTDYWLSGTGGSGKGDIDMVCTRDADGCPSLPMTQVKGMLRETAKLVFPDKVDDYFGEQKEPGESPPPKEGFLRFSGNASMPEGERAWFAEHKDARAALFSRLRSTKITPAGVAQTNSLRTLEVAIPLQLIGSVQWVGSGAPPKVILDTLCKLTFAFGHGKNDGLGRAIASCSEFALDSAAQPIEATDKRLVIDLVPEDLAVFSRANANEGQQLSHAGPTGASLWGWAIGRLKDDPVVLRLLLSGNIAFSDAAPLIDKRTPAFMRPAVLFLPKQAKPDETTALGKDKVFNPSALRIGMKSYVEEHTEDRQAQGFGSYHMPLALNGVAPVGKGHRLRSAHKDGKAEDAKLFGYQHIAQRVTGYRAVIEAQEGVCPELWDRVVKAFQNRLFLGKARNNGYGGGYKVAAAPKAAEFVPEQTVAAGTTIARIWCLSDLALHDDWGALNVEPCASDFGLPEDWTLRLTESAVTTRRYAPWDSAIQGHESEITVIEAGSVFAFTGTTLTKDIPLPERIADYRERGCGLIALVPEAMPQETVAAIDPDITMAPAESNLTKWAARRVQEYKRAALDDWVAEAYKVIDNVKKVPSKTQWSMVKLDGTESALDGPEWESKQIGDQSLKDWLIAQAKFQLNGKWSDRQKATARKRLIDHARRAKPAQSRGKQ